MVFIITKTYNVCKVTQSSSRYDMPSYTVKSNRETVDMSVTFPW